MRKADARRFIVCPRLGVPSKPDDPGADSANRRFVSSLSTRRDRCEARVLSAALELLEDRAEPSRRSDRRGSGRRDGEGVTDEFADPDDSFREPPAERAGVGRRGEPPRGVELRRSRYLSGGENESVSDPCERRRMESTNLSLTPFAQSVDSLPPFFDSPSTSASMTSQSSSDGSSSASSTIMSFSAELGASASESSPSERCRRLAGCSGEGWRDVAGVERLVMDVEENVASAVPDRSASRSGSTSASATSATSRSTSGTSGRAETRDVVVSGASEDSISSTSSSLSGPTMESVSRPPKYE